MKDDVLLELSGAYERRALVARIARRVPGSVHEVTQRDARAMANFEYEEPAPPPGRVVSSEEQRARYFERLEEDAADLDERRQQYERDE